MREATIVGKNVLFWHIYMLPRAVGSAYVPFCNVTMVELDPWLTETTVYSELAKRQKCPECAKVQSEASGSGRKK